MTVTINISPDMEELLRRSALVKGLPLENYIERLIEEQITKETSGEAIHEDEWVASLRGLAMSLPPLSDEAMSRESMYD